MNCWSRSPASRLVRPGRSTTTIPKELERICLKALAKRASERYSTAKDMADDLRHFWRKRPPRSGPRSRRRARNEARWQRQFRPDDATRLRRQAIKIVPKGLRSFDAQDADFFLELLPGPRDREGLPDSIRFWKTRIETTDPDSTFSVGLIYGPSGCGKSSLVKAGLLPRLATSVTAVYVEATGEETEARLLKGLRRQLPDLPDQSRPDRVAGGIAAGAVLASRAEGAAGAGPVRAMASRQAKRREHELVQALRQCDGGRVQCIVMVRDDFWLAATRFMAALEIRASSRATTWRSSISSICAMPARC